MSKAAIRELIAAITEIAEVVRDLDPGRPVTFERIENHLATARERLARDDE